MVNQSLTYLSVSAAIGLTFAAVGTRKSEEIDGVSSMGARVSEIGDGLIGASLAVGAGKEPAPKLARTKPPEVLPPKRDEGPAWLGGAGPVDMLDLTAKLRPVANLLTEANAQAPIAVALIGAPGTGKSFALNALAKAIGGERGAATLVARVDASLDAPAQSLAAAAFKALRDGGAEALAESAMHATGDAKGALEAARGAHDALSRRLDEERGSRDEFESKRARLADALLYETPSSRVDAFVRLNRLRIERQMRRFGLVRTEATRDFRDTLRDMGASSTGSRFPVALRAVTAYRGQKRLLASGAAFFALAFGANALRSDWAGQTLQGLGEWGGAAAGLIKAHEDIFERGVEGLMALGLFCVVLNLWRAVSYATTLSSGLRQLNLDLQSRRRDLDDSLQRTGARIGDLTKDYEASRTMLDRAAKRAGDAGGGANDGLEFLPGPDAAARSRAFLADLSKRLAAPGQSPRRIAFFIDGTELREPGEALSWLERAGTLVGPGFAMVATLDADRLKKAAPDVGALRARLERIFVLPIDLAALASFDPARYLARKLDGALAGPDIKPPTQSMAEPMGAGESTLMTALAPYAGKTPRALDRFLNLYRLLRTEPLPKPALALAALATCGDDPAMLIALRSALGQAETRIDEAQFPLALANATQSARGAQGGDIDARDMRNALAAAERYRWPLG